MRSTVKSLIIACISIFCSQTLIAQVGGAGGNVQPKDEKPLLRTVSVTPNSLLVKVSTLKSKMNRDTSRRKVKHALRKEKAIRSKKQ